MKLQQEDALRYADRYDSGYDAPVAAIVEAVRNRGWLTVEEFIVVGRWKTPRVRSRLLKNSEPDVEEAMRAALAARSPPLAVHILQALNGVGMPVASTILHWFHEDRFPILDYRALWTLQIEMPSAYSLDFWERYVERTRALAEVWGTDMRTLDRALWQYTNENQREL